jgi:prepilin-type N-terminal cleavage/methylation domain-containing protein
MRHLKRLPRQGFTLIELLVVIGLIVVLASMVLLVAPRFSDGQKSALGASRVQGYLAIAKQRAYRDNLNWGVRFNRLSPNPATADYNIVETLDYVVQPDDFYGGTLSTGSSLSTVTITGVSCLDASGNTGAIQPGDFLEVWDLSDATDHYIQSANCSATGATLQLASNLSAASPAGGWGGYRIIRQPRTVAGEPPLQLPQDMCVDLRYSLPNPLQSTTVLFTPGGAVLSSSAKLIFWVRNETKDSPYDGDPTLVVVYTRTGAVAAHPVNLPSPPTYPPPNGWDLYSFTKDGRSSGL